MDNKWFGREPTLWLAVVAGVLNIIVGFGIDGFSAEQAALANTVINAIMGAVAAVLTRPIAPQAFTYLASSIFGLLAAYGLNVSQELVGSTNILVLAVLSLLARGQVSPAPDARTTGVLGDKVTTGGPPPTGS